MSSYSSLDPRVPEPMTGFVGSVGGLGDRSILKAFGTRFGADFVLGTLARAGAGIVLLMLVALVLVLVVGAYPSMKEFGFHFITSTKWMPEHQMIKYDANGNTIPDETGNDTMITVPGEFGALPFIYGTVVSSALALLFAVPMSLGAALFLVRIGPWLTSTFVKSGILGLLLAFLLIAIGGNWSATLAMLGGFLGLAGICFLCWLAWIKEDPRVGPTFWLQAVLHIGVPAVVLLLALFEGAGWTWSLIWAALAGGVLGELGQAGVSILSFMIEFLAAIPSIAYGLWGLFVVVPFLGQVEPTLNQFLNWIPFLRVLHTDNLPTGRDMFAAGLILAIMILPIITAIGRDVLRAVPRIQVEGTQALGATWWQSSWAMLRYGRSGLFGAVMLGLARAAGETMAVTMVIGNMNHINFSIFEKAQTMSSLLANEFKETSARMQVSALVEVGLILLTMSLIFNIVARFLVVGTGTRAGGA